MTELVVAKFGGTSVATFEAMQRSCALVANNPRCRLVFVSAPGGVTNHLVGICQGSQPPEQIQTTLDAIAQQVLGIAKQCAQPKNIIEKVHGLLDDLAHVTNINHNEYSPSQKDELLAFGERFASLLFSQILNEMGHQACEFDVRTVMKTNDLFGMAQPNVEQLKNHCNLLLKPLLEDSILVTQGFIGQTDSGQTTTLGRGGSDYSAALLAEALEANVCEIWTDVPGVFTTDPRIVDNAFALPELSYDEAAEMANFGAKVLHPATLAPTLRKNIPVFVGSSKAPDLGGTLLVKDCQEEPPFRAITRRREQDLVTLQTPKMLPTSRFIGDVFSILESHGLGIDLITTSETSISLTFNDPSNTSLERINKNVIHSLQQICDVNIEESLDLITLVGNHLHEKEGTACTIFTVLKDFKIRMICYGANPHNISFLVNNEDSTEIVKVLHQALFEG